MNLEECRKKINLLDDQICDLFVERMKVSSEVAKAKMAAKNNDNKMLDIPSINPITA